MTAYYNEIDPAAAHILRALIARNVIAPGEVDERSIVDIRPDDLRGFTQCHFFAGGGLWSVAARLAGGPDDRPLWTGPCPCQGESNAGKRLGAADPRHLWPDFFRLVRSARPSVLVGEQVAAAVGTHWLDGTLSDLDAEGYAARAVSVPACAVDAPHQRDRLYWVAIGRNVDDRERPRLEGQCGHVEGGLGRPGPARSVAATDGSSQSDAACIGRREGWAEPTVRSGWDAASDTNARLCADADEPFIQGQPSAGQLPIIEPDAGALRNGSWWADAEWIRSPLDGKARRSKPGIRFLVNGLPSREDLWRIGGNAIVPQVAAEVLAALAETIDGGLK